MRVEVQPVGRFGEAKERVHAGHHNPRIDGENFDADERHPYEDVDNQTLVKNEFDHLGQAAGPTAGISLDLSITSSLRRHSQERAPLLPLPAPTGRRPRLLVGGSPSSS